MPETFTFVNTTLDNETRLRGVILSQVQSHVATVKHARDRAARRKLLKEERSHPSFSGDCTDSIKDPSNQSLVTSHHATASIKQEPSLEVHRLICNPNIEIASSLDPFLRVPLDLSPQERSLVHYWLSDGRSLFWGISRDPPFCPSLHCTNALSDSRDIHLLVQRLTAESLLCRTKHHELSPNFYVRRAQVYRAMNHLLDDVHADFHNKMAAFLTISIMEHILNRPDLQAKHVHAMDRYLESRGSLSELVSRTVNGEYLLDPPWFVGHFMYNTTPDYSNQGFESILRRFTYSLQCIRTWAFNLAAFTQDPAIEPPEQQRQQPIPSLSVLQTYLSWVLETYFTNPSSTSTSTPPPTSLKCGPLHLLLGLCLTQTIYTYDPPTSISFLTRAQTCFEQSSLTSVSSPSSTNPTAATSSTPSTSTTTTSPTHTITKPLAPGALGTMMGYIRYAILPKDNAKEVEISQACVDALRLLPLISPATRYALARDLRDCAMVAVDTVSERCLSEEFVGDLRREIEGAWKARRGRIG